jgi:hypothetical protein
MTRSFGGFAVACCLSLAMGACSKDDNPAKNDGKASARDGSAAGSCLQQQTNACATEKTSCVSKCVADQACLEACQVSFCNCMSKAGCAPTAECKDPSGIDGGTKPPSDTGAPPVKDGGKITSPDAGGVSCPQAESTACATTKASCVAACVADQDCLDGCQVDFCDCLNTAGCAPPAECKI